ncbi:medium-chain fatty acid-CoA ligase faa2 [Coemansia sp. RSA 2559]|nr:medium-chain fatty acid-CoA ligase faa2 [Coemansia sp. RSA 2559]
MSVSADPALLLTAGIAIIVAAVYFYYYSPHANQPDIHPLQLAQQSFPSRVRESPHESPVYRSKATPEGVALVSTPVPEVSTLRDLIRMGRRSPRPDAVKFMVDGKIQRISSEVIASRSVALAGGLLRTVPESQDGATRAVAICIESSADFLVAYQACIEAGIAAILIPAAESLAAVEAILRDSRACVLIASTAATKRFGACFKNTHLSCTIVAGDLDGSKEADAVRSATKVLLLADLEQGVGPEQDSAISPSDPAYVTYQPGFDTNAPHGVVTTHANALAAVGGLMASVPAAQQFSSKDSFMATSSMALPVIVNLIHLALFHSCSLSILDTIDAEEFSKQAYLLEPTYVHLDPLLVRDLVQLFYSHIANYPMFEHKMFTAGYRRSVDSLMRGMTPKRNIWDFFYFRHYRNLLGGKLRLMYVDGPSTPSKSIEWLRALHGAKVIPVFGSPQTTAVTTAGGYYDYASAIETHNVGAPLACNEIKVVDADDTKDGGVALSVDPPAASGGYPRGVLVVRGPNISDTVWSAGKQQKAAGACDADGWLRLPVYAEILPNGTIDIIGTRQTVLPSPLPPSGNLFIELLERVLATSRAVTDVCVVAKPNSRKIGIVAHPRPMELATEARRSRREYKLKIIDEYPWTAEYIREKLIETAGLIPTYQWIKDVPLADITVKLVPEPFLVANEMAFIDGSTNRRTAEKLLSKK